MKFHTQALQDKLDIQKQNFALRHLDFHLHNGVDFCSNDYLGLAKNGILHTDEMHGASGSRLISGNSIQYENLEKKIAQFHGFEAALIYNSGYAANTGLISCLASENDTIIFDEFVHASIRDGIKLSKAAAIKFLHNDLNDAETKLQKSQGKKWLLIESLYSMDGDISPLQDFVHLAKKYDAAIIIDEAHSLGTLSKLGKGIVYNLQLQNEIFATVYTYGKALGCHGAVVCGSNTLRQYLINFSRPFIYSTALPNHALSAIEQSYEKLSKAENEIQCLHENISFFIQKCKAHQLSFSNNNSPIQSLIISGNEHVIHVAQKLNEAGFYVKPIRYPTVPKGKERLRICLHSYNTKNEISRLIETIAALVK